MCLRVTFSCPIVLLYWNLTRPLACNRSLSVTLRRDVEVEIAAVVGNPSRQFGSSVLISRAVCSCEHVASEIELSWLAFGSSLTKLMKVAACGMLCLSYAC